ncbi:MAG: glycosyltransferase family 39 protein [Sciscionella sp.]|nr:glycosyltransferase family 39 protein [Sciscionella sp.]
MGALNGRPARDVLTAWDAQWYLGIAGGGYDNVPAGLVDAHGMRGPNTALAFFPGYPAAIRAVATLPGVSLVAAAFTVSMIAGIAGSYGLVRIGERIRGGSRWIGLILVALFAAAPMAIVESMAYSETLFCALAAWSLAALLKRDWVAAGVCCALAGLVRPTAAALILAVCLAALVAIVNRRDGWRPWVGGLLAPLGLAGYLGWVAIRTGSLTGYFQLQQAGWDSHFDGGAGTWKFSVEVLNNSRDPMLLLSLGTIIAFLIMLALGYLRRVEWPLMIYGLAVLVLDLGSYGLMNSKARLLLPAFTLLIPVAVGLAGRKRSTAIAVLVGVTLFSAWFGGYSLTVWPYAI